MKNKTTTEHSSSSTCVSLLPSSPQNQVENIDKTMLNTKKKIFFCRHSYDKQHAKRYFNGNIKFYYLSKCRLLKTQSTNDTCTLRLVVSILSIVQFHE